jgi:GTP-binding protein HflX
VADADVVLHVVDGSHPDPEGQLAAVREVLADVGAEKVAELVVVNKVDAGNPDVIRRLLRSQPGAVAVSARTGQGMEELIAVLTDRLPRPRVEVDVVVPYTRGDLVHRVHTDGEVLGEEHTADGTRLHAHVSPWLATELTRTSAIPAPQDATAG